MPVKTDVQRSLVDKTKTRCFFDIGIKEENERLGRIVFELYDTIAPLTCENFAAFCRGTNGLSYKYVNYVKYRTSMYIIYGIIFIIKIITRDDNYTTKFSPYRNLVSNLLKL